VGGEKMQFSVTKNFNGGPESGPFKIAKLTIVVLTGDPIEDPGKPQEFTQVDITVLFDHNVLFKSDDDLKADIAGTFDIPVANVEFD
jgi:hypothetical protein